MNSKKPIALNRNFQNSMGLRDVQTYIQSGNVVFNCNLKNRAALAA
jgi:uncharacterized protein (DUF1697 family)